MTYIDEGSQIVARGSSSAATGCLLAIGPSIQSLKSASVVASTKWRDVDSVELGKSVRAFLRSGAHLRVALLEKSGIEGAELEAQLKIAAERERDYRAKFESKRGRTDWPKGLGSSNQTLRHALLAAALGVVIPAIQRTCRDRNSAVAMARKVRVESEYVFDDFTGAPDEKEGLERAIGWVLQVEKYRLILGPGRQLDLGTPTVSFKSEKKESCLLLLDQILGLAVSSLLPNYKLPANLNRTTCDPLADQLQDSASFSLNRVTVEQVLKGLAAADKMGEIQSNL